MLEYKIIIGSIAGALALFSHLPYFIDVFRGRTKPHLFTWFIWTLILSIGVAVQVVEGAGPGAWATIGDGIACLIVVLLCFSYGEKVITRSDWVSLAFGVLGVVLWALTSEPLWAAVLVTLADAFGFFPTFRKAYMKPHEETPSTFLMVFASYVLALTVFDSYSLTTILYPVYLMLANGSFWLYILVRRHQLKKTYA